MMNRSYCGKKKKKKEEEEVYQTLHILDPLL
jgi:hypothetical protein